MPEWGYMPSANPLLLSLGNNKHTINTMFWLQDWMSAAEYAVEGMADARAAAAWSAPEVTLEQQASASASAALLMAEVGALGAPGAGSTCPVLCPNPQS